MVLLVVLVEVVQQTSFLLVALELLVKVMLAVLAMVFLA
jgi:hypothetical protein